MATPPTQQRRSARQRPNRSSLSTPPITPTLRRKNPCRSNKRGLPLHLQKQLLQDIEASGGFFSSQAKSYYFLRNICDKRPDYGASGSSTREQIRYKFNAWRDFTPPEYFSLLSQFGITPYAGIPSVEEPSKSSPPWTPRTKGPPSPPSSSEESESSSESSPEPRVRFRQGTASPVISSPSPSQRRAAHNRSNNMSSSRRYKTTGEDPPAPDEHEDDVTKLVLDHGRISQRYGGKCSPSRGPTVFLLLV